MMVREVWVNLLNYDRSDRGEFYTLYPDLRHFPKRFFRFFPMSVGKFAELLEICEPSLTRQHTNFRAPNLVEQQLVLTLRYA